MGFMHILLSLIVGGSNCKFLEKNSLSSLSYSENDIKTPLPFYKMLIIFPLVQFTPTPTPTIKHKRVKFAVEILHIIFVIVKPFFFAVNGNFISQ